MADLAPPTAPRMGTLHGISLGPGDPGLVTRAAWAALERRDAIWVYPVRSGKTPSYALDIVQRAGLPLPETHTPLLFPMTHDGEKLARAWLKASALVLSLSTPRPGTTPPLLVAINKAAMAASWV